MAQVELITGDLLAQDVDAIVNAWNRNVIPWWLLLPQGVAGAIRRRGGTGPFRELGRHGMLRPGDAVVTGAGRLPFKAIIHVAALDLLWRSSPAIVRTAATSALAAAAARGFSSVAVPLLGAGVGGVRPAESQEIIGSVAREHAFGGLVLVVRFGRP